MCLGANLGDVCQSLDEAEKADKEEGRAWQGYFSHSSCLVFMVFDRAWSLSPPSLSLLLPLSLFTFNPVLEVPCALLVTFFVEDLILASFSVNRKNTDCPITYGIKLGGNR